RVSFFLPTPPTQLLPLSLHDALPIFSRAHLEGTDFLDVSLESLCNSSSVIHEGPCFIDHRTVLRSLRAATLKDCLLRMGTPPIRSEEHTSELQSRFDLVCRLLLEKKK